MYTATNYPSVINHSENRKMELLERLVKEGHITLEEAMLLTEKEKEYVYIPQSHPWDGTIVQPSQPYQPQPIWYGINPYNITCSTVNSPNSNTTTYTYKG